MSGLVMVAMDCTDATQRRLDEDDTIYDHQGPEIELSEVKDALAEAPYIEYDSESRFEKRNEEDWQKEARDWLPSRCRIYSRHVVEVMEVYEP